MLARSVARGTAQRRVEPARDLPDAPLRAIDHNADNAETLAVSKGRSASDLSWAFFPRHTFSGSGGRERSAAGRRGPQPP